MTVVGDIPRVGKSLSGALGIPFVVGEIVHGKNTHGILASGQQLGRSKIQEKEIWESGMKIDFGEKIDTKCEDFD